MRYHFLVEKYEAEPELIRVTWRDIVVALQPTNAFIIAETRYANRPTTAPYKSWRDRITDDTWRFEYTPDQIKEVQPGYLWTFADGDAVWYELRCLGSL